VFSAYGTWRTASSSAPRRIQSIIDLSQQDYPFLYGRPPLFLRRCMHQPRMR